MKKNKFVFGLICGILLSMVGFFSFNFINSSPGIVKNINTENFIEKKIFELKESIKGLSLGNNTYQNEINKLKEIKKILETQHIAPSMISGDQMWEDAIQAFVSSLGDPFTVYLTPEDNKTLHEELKGTSDFQGIGAIVSKSKDGVMLKQIFKNSPAAKSGLKPLDVVLKADGKSLAPLPLGKAIGFIKGPAGTEVNLTIKRGDEIFEVVVVRDKIEIKSSNYEIKKYKGKKYLYISISSIGIETYMQIKDIIENTNKYNGIILDLRGNGGGYLEIGYKIGSLWTKKGDIVVKTEYRNSSLNKVFYSKTKGKVSGFPTVVLIDGNTASAGEIIAGAIRENNQNTSKLIGTQTFGKGTIQVLHKFKDASSLKYTIGKWLTPKGNSVSKDYIFPGNGINPDIEVVFDFDLYKKNLTDNQLESAKKHIYELSK